VLASAAGIFGGRVLILPYLIALCSKFLLPALPTASAAAHQQHLILTNNYNY
jgi:hypothetical protein